MTRLRAGLSIEKGFELRFHKLKYVLLHLKKYTEELLVRKETNLESDLVAVFLGKYASFSLYITA